MINIRQFFVYSLLLGCILGQAQSFDRMVTNTTLKIGEKDLGGFLTKFDFSPDNVRLSWWKYAKRFALPKNQRQYYEVTIPATNDSKSVTIYTQMNMESTKPIDFKLALNTTGMSEEDKKKYLDQAKALLIDFKRWHYLRHFEEKLERLEKSINKSAGTNWDQWMAFIVQRDAILEQMKGI
jgi:hypothetical protein